MEIVNRKNPVLPRCGWFYFTAEVLYRFLYWVFLGALFFIGILDIKSPSMWYQFFGCYIIVMVAKCIKEGETKGIFLEMGWKKADEKENAKDSD
jgi:hypothetical protein